MYAHAQKVFPTSSTHGPLENPVPIPLEYPAWKYGNSLEGHICSPVSISDRVGAEVPRDLWCRRP